MDLDLHVSRRMTLDQDDSTVRMPNIRRKKLGVHIGGTISATTKLGSKAILIVDDPHIEDELDNYKVSWVSQATFDKILGIKNEPDKITLGCDPEFVILDRSGNIIPANYWLSPKGPIGSDGPLVEVRPLPAKHETEAIENIRSLLRSLPTIIRNNLNVGRYTVEGHSCWQNNAIGFHIHLGIPRELLTYAAPGAQQFLSYFVAGLDYFVGIPAMLLEDNSIRRLGNGDYGKPGDYRLTNKTIEYRTPGGFHLRHPSYAAGIMGLAMCYAESTLQKAREISNEWRELERYCGYDWLKSMFELPEKREIEWLLCEPTKKAATRQLPNIVDKLTKMGAFTNHTASIRTYFGLLAKNRQYSANILDNW